MRVFYLIYYRVKVLCLFIVCLGKRTILDPRLSLIGKEDFNVDKKSTIKNVIVNLNNGSLNINSGCWINNGVEFNPIGKIVIKKNTSIQRNSTVNGTVSIGHDVIIAPNVFISSSTHIFEYKSNYSTKAQDKLISKKEFLELYNKPIFIGDGAWLGINVVVMPGVSIGDHAIVGANSVVTKNVPEKSVMAGIPAKRVGDATKGFKPYAVIDDEKE